MKITYYRIDIATAVSDITSEIYDSMMQFKEQILAFKTKLLASDVGNRIATGAFWSFAGTAVAKFFVLVASIICAHILTKQEYGEFGMVRSTINMFVVFGTAGLGLTATKYISEFRDNKKDRIASIYILTNGFAIVTGLIVTSLVLLFAPYLAKETLKVPELEPSIRIGAILLFVTIINGAQNGVLSGYERFKTIARNNLIGSVVESICMLVGAYYWRVFGAVLGYGISFVIIYIVNYYSIRRLFKEDKIQVALSKFNKEDFRLLYKFSLPAALCSILVTPTIWGVKTILTNKSGFEELAVFEVGDQWRTIILFIPTAVSQVVLPVLSSIISEESSKFWKVLKTNLYLNAGVALVMAIFISLFSPVIMKLYGKAFISDYGVLIILAISTVFSSMANVVGLAISSRSKMWTGFVFNTIWAIMLIVFTLIFINMGLGAKGLALSFTLSYVVHTALQLLYLRHISR